MAAGNRVKTVRLRGEMSFGLVIKPEEKFPIGADVTDYYKITKYVPKPNIRYGNKCNTAVMNPLWARFTEVEHLRSNKRAIPSGTEVVCLEKIDGCQVNIGMLDGKLNIGSRNLCRARPVRAIDPGYSRWEKVVNAVTEVILRKKWYYRQDWEYNTEVEKTDWFCHLIHIPEVMNLITELGKTHKTVTLYGESFGPVQKLNYGSPNQLKFLAYGLKIDNRFLDWSDFLAICDRFKVPVVPIVAYCKYDFDEILWLAEGKTLIPMENPHMREGIVVMPLKESINSEGRRNVYKVINSEYLLAKEGGKIDDSTDE